MYIPIAPRHYVECFLNGESLGKQRKLRDFSTDNKTLTILSFVCYSTSPKEDAIMNKTNDIQDTINKILTGLKEKGMAESSIKSEYIRRL